MTTLSNGVSIYDFSFGNLDLQPQPVRGRQKSQKEKESKYDRMYFLIEQFFNSDMFTWPLFNSTCASLYIGLFMFYKLTAEYFLDWDVIEGPNEQQIMMKKRTRKFLLVNTILTNNYMYLIVWYYFIDMNSIYPTNFEVFVYFIIFLQQTFVLSVIKIIDKFIAEVIDA